MNGLGHRVALLRHLIVFSLRGLDLGFIRTHVFHCIGVGCSFNQVAATGGLAVPQRAQISL